MDQYAEVIGNDASVDDYLRMASHFRENNEHFKAGEFFFKAEMFNKVNKCCNYNKLLLAIVGFVTFSSLPHVYVSWWRAY